MKIRVAVVYFYSLGCSCKTQMQPLEAIHK